MRKEICILLGIIILWFVFFRNDSVNLGEGVFAPGSPDQENIASPKSFSFNDYLITPLVKFHIKAKVLSKKRYRFDREATLSPFDLALGWGNMSDEKILKVIDISQSNRWYRWWTKKFPIPRKEIETHSANMHLIPSNKKVKSIINKTRKGEIVEFSGALVRVDAKDKWRWISSLTRNDTGAHACEVVWVEKFEIMKY